MNDSEASSAFKICTMCKKKWIDRESFLSDPLLEMMGYQADIDDLEYGLFLFNHNEKNCGSTIAIRVHAFKDLYKGPVYSECLFGTEDCHELCLHKDNLEPCPAKCECSYVRELSFFNTLMIMNFLIYKKAINQASYHTAFDELQKEAYYDKRIFEYGKSVFEKIIKLNLM